MHQLRVAQVEQDRGVGLLFLCLTCCLIARDRAPQPLRHQVHLHLVAPQPIVRAVERLDLESGVIAWAHNLLDFN